MPTRSSQCCASLWPWAFCHAIANYRRGLFSQDPNKRWYNSHVTDINVSRIGLGNRCRVWQVFVPSLSRPRKEIGTHSIRKGAATYVCGGSTGGPSIVSVCLRCGWAIGNVIARYFRYESAGNQFVGRVVAGLPVNSSKFPTLPPHFPSNSNVSVDESLQKLFPNLYHCASLVGVLKLVLASRVSPWVSRQQLNSRPRFAPNYLVSWPKYVNIPQVNFIVRDVSDIERIWCATTRGIVRSTRKNIVRPLMQFQNLYWQASEKSWKNLALRLARSRVTYWNVQWRKCCRCSLPNKPIIRPPKCPPQLLQVVLNMFLECEAEDSIYCLNIIKSQALTFFPVGNCGDLAIRCKILSHFGK